MSPGPVTGRAAWLGAALLTLAVVAGLATLRPLVAPGSWTVVTACAVAGVAAVTATARTVGRTRFAPTLWGVVVALGVVATLWSAPTGPTVPLPTLGTLRGLRRTADAGVAAIVESHIPVEPSAGVQLLVAAGALVVLLLADLLALGLRRPGAAGLPLVALWAVAVVFERRTPLPVLLLGGTAFLLLLALVRPERRAPVRQDAGRQAAATTLTAVAVTLVAVLAAPLLAVVPVWGSVRLPTTWGDAAGSGPVELSLDLDMRASLGTQSGRTLLTYTSDGPSTGPLRLYTLTAFDGRQWQRDDSDPSGPDEDVSGVLWPTSLDGPRDRTTLHVRVGDLDTDRLPVPVDPRSVTVPPGGGWRYDPGRDEVHSGSDTTRGLVYEVVVLDRDLSSEALQADVPADVDPGSPYLQLPETPSADDVRALALEVTAGAATAHDQAVALQSWFRDSTLFRYDTRVSAARSEDAVWDFLTDRRGYCVQYATAMTLMARHLGIPARMGVGFLPGRSTPSGEHIVTGQRAHTWPELWFAEAGWVRFEPTPAVQTGAPPVYADPLAVDPRSPEERTPTTPTAQPTTSPTTPRPGGTPTPGGEVTLGGAHVPRLLVVAVAAALVLAVLVVRARRSERPPVDAEAAWERMRRRLARRGVGWSDAGTPRTVVHELLEGLDPELRDEAAAALQALLTAVEAERYAPRSEPVDPDLLAEWVEEVDAAFARRGATASKVPVEA